MVAFLATGVAVFVYGYLQKAQAVDPMNTAFIWAFMLRLRDRIFISIRHYA